MERDMDLCRSILLALEEGPFTTVKAKLDIPGYTEEQVSYRIYLLNTAGFINALNVSSQNGQHSIAQNMTMPGHDLLDLGRNNTNWNKAKSFIAEKGQSITIETMKAVCL